MQRLVEHNMRLKMEQTDRDLIEAAAKAAGIAGRWNEARGFNLRTDVWPKIWNPLEDDGDALRLAVRLGMEVYIDTHPDGCDCTEAQSVTARTPENAMRSIVSHDGDAAAATRRAIVIAAAEAGRAGFAPHNVGIEPPERSARMTG